MSIAVGIVFGIIFFLLMVGLIAVVFRWLWNSTVPDVFGANEISIGQAIKILILASMLFGTHRAVEVNPPQWDGASAQQIGGDR